MIHIFKKP